MLLAGDGSSGREAVGCLQCRRRFAIIKGEGNSTEQTLGGSGRGGSGPVRGADAGVRNRARGEGVEE